MKKYLFVINPIAGDGRAKSVKPLIEEIMTKNQIDYDIVFTKEPKEATSIALNYDYDVLVAVGGDGTVNEIAAGIIKRDNKILAIIPAGTGNDLSRSLDIPFDLEEAIERIIKGNPREIIVGISNGHSFLNISSVGFDVETLINHKTIRKKIKGNLSYVLAVIYTLFKFKKRKVTIDIDGKIFERNLMLLAIGNGKYYGGGMKIIPNADPYDDYLYVCLVKDVSNLRALTVLPGIFEGNHLKLTKYVETYKANNIKISSDTRFFLNIDGEVVEEGNEIFIKTNDNKLSIIL